MDIKAVGIYLAKTVIQVCVCLSDHLIQNNQKVSRNKLLHRIRQLPEGTLIAMEACRTSQPVIIGDVNSKRWAIG